MKTTSWTVDNDESKMRLSVFLPHADPAASELPLDYWPGTAGQLWAGAPCSGQVWAAWWAAWRAAWRDSGSLAAQGSSSLKSFHHLPVTQTIQSQCIRRDVCYYKLGLMHANIWIQLYLTCSIPIGAELALLSSQPAAATRHQTAGRE